MSKGQFENHFFSQTSMMTSQYAPVILVVFLLARLSDCRSPGMPHLADFYGAQNVASDDQPFGPNIHSNLSPVSSFFNPVRH